MKKLSLSTLSICLITFLSIAGCNKKPVEAHSVNPAASPASAASETATPPTIAATPAAPTAATPFDLDSVAMTTVNLPPFPYVDYPVTLDESYRSGLPPTPFDIAYVIAGNELKTVEGKVSIRHFPNNPAKLSVVAAQRNYDEAIKALGGVKVNKLEPTDPAFIKAQPSGLETLLGKLHINDSPRSDNHGLESFSQYLIRTNKTNIWIAVIEENGGITTTLVTVEEKALEQSVALIKADAMAASLQTQGHVALYLSFDTDSDVIKSASKPVVEEIVKLLRSDDNLQLNIEGHTDNVGSAEHNKTLSLARARAVVKEITDKGIAAARLNAIGLGAEKPLQDNTTEQGRAKNRRVELVKR